MASTTTNVLENSKELKCCVCGAEFDVGDHPHLVDYWGSDEPIDDECGHCGAKLSITEHVARTWTIVVKADGPPKAA